MVVAACASALEPKPSVPFLFEKEEIPPNRHHLKSRNLNSIFLGQVGGLVLQDPPLPAATRSHGSIVWSARSGAKAMVG